MEPHTDWQKPTPAEVWRAVETYLPLAYPKGHPSVTIQGRIDSLKRIDPDQFYTGPLLERPAGDNPPRFALRLGNSFYPHMKLMIEPTPDRAGYMFRADTHDRHIRPPADSPEYPLFCELMEKNQRLSERIEAAWEAAGLPTFKQFLRDDLARRIKTDR